MKRRMFLRLTGALAVLGLPWVSHARQLCIAEDSVVFPPVGPDIQWPNDSDFLDADAQILEDLSGWREFMRRKNREIGSTEDYEEIIALLEHESSK